MFRSEPTFVLCSCPSAQHESAHALRVSFKHVPSLREKMDSFVHNGDFDFGVFSSTPGPTIEPKPKVEKKRRERDSSWKNRNEEHTNELPYSKGRQSHSEAPPPKKPHIEKQQTETSSKEPTNNGTQHNEKPFNNNNNNNFKNNDKNADNKKGNKPEKKWNFDAKEVWEPDETDIANTIHVEQGDGMFLGEFSDTGLSKRLVSTVVSMFLTITSPLHPLPLYLR